MEAQQGEIEKLRQQLGQRDAELVKLQLRLLEKQAEINQLAVSQEHSIQEVVRAKAKLRSRSNKAESVANMAEVVMVIKTVKNKPLTEQQKSTVNRAEQLMQMSNLALEESNFDGASYLAGQAMNLVRPIITQVEGEEGGNNGDQEVTFVSPLELQVLRRSNIRSRPDINSKIRFILDQGVVVKAYAYNGEWIRLRTSDDRNGWIYYQLVGTKK